MPTPVPTPVPADVARIQGFIRTIALLGRSLADLTNTTIDNEILDVADFLADPANDAVIRLVLLIRGKVVSGESLAGAIQSEAGAVGAAP